MPAVVAGAVRPAALVAVAIHPLAACPAAARRVREPRTGRALTDRLGADRAIGLEARDHLGRDCPVEELLDVPKERRLVDAHERDRIAGLLGSTGPTDPVDVVLGDNRQLE